MTILFRTGFEMGSSNGLVLDGNMSSSEVLSVVTTLPNTGNYCASLPSNAWAQWVVNGNEVYFSLYLRHSAKFSVSNKTKFVAYLDNGEEFGIQFDVFYGRWSAIVDGVVVASGSITFPISSWTHVQCRLLHHATAGKIQVYAEGILELDVDIATAISGSAQIDYLRIQTPNHVGYPTFFMDDFWVDDSGYPGNLRAEALLPTADAALADWLLSSGSDMFDLVDEVPFNDGNYLYTEIDGDQFTLDLSDWNGTGKTLHSVSLWHRAWKDVAAAHQLKIIDSDGSNVNVGPGIDLLTTPTYIAKHLTLAPDGTTWSDAKLDALEIGAEGEIV